MKTLLIALALIAFSCVATGCTTISYASYQGVSSNHWVIKNTKLWGIDLSSDVYYCPPDGSKCVKATIK